MTTASEAAADQPSAARLYDYYFTGEGSRPVDRAAAQQAIQAYPDVESSVRENREFTVRTIRYLAGTAGIDQFLDLGTGIPASPNPHEVAQGINPAARVVYVDKDPDALAHAKLTGTPEGRVRYVRADIRDVDALLAETELRDTLDLSRPVALSLYAMIHQIPDEENPYGIVSALVDALPSGSYLTVSQPTAEQNPGAVPFADVYRRSGIPFQLRGEADLRRFFDGLEILPPGVVRVHRWRPDPDTPTELTDAQVSVQGALGRKA
jgi:hypothetical protein